MAGAAALAVTACSGDGGSELPADAEPAEVVAAGLNGWMEDGAAFTVNVEGDLQALAEESGEPLPPEVEAMLTEGLVSGAFDPEGGFALTLGADDGFLEMRAVEEAVYLRLDITKVAETFPEAGELPSPEQLRAQLETMPLPEDVATVAEAALDGDWVGITGLSQETLQEFAEGMGQAVPSQDEVEAQEEAIRSILEERGLLDGTAFTERYLTVDGDGPTYDITLMARDLVTTFEEISAEVEESLGPAAAGSMGELPDPQEVPEAISGFSVTVEDGRATAISGDIAAIAESAGESVEELEAGDLLVTLQFEELGDQLAVPDAVTVDFESLVTGVMGGLMGGTGGLTG